MNFINGKILKEKMKDEEEGLTKLSRLTKLNFLPKFCRLDVQVLVSIFFLSTVIFKIGF